MTLLGVLAVAALSLAACGNKAGDVTCSAFGQQGTSDRTQTLNDLLSEHSLEVASMGNQLGVSKNVDAFCGTATMLQTPATQNLDRTLNDAVNWDTKQW
jgi:predicted outer membrane protein